MKEKNKEHELVFPSHDSIERIREWRISLECLKHVDHILHGTKGVLLVGWEVVSFR